MQPEARYLCLLGRITKQNVTPVGISCVAGSHTRARARAHTRTHARTQSVRHVAACSEPQYSKTNQCQCPLNRLQELGRRILQQEGRFVTACRFDGCCL
jgi:hypothetical protein